MPTVAQEAFAEGFTALAETHGIAPWVFGAASFDGIELQLEPSDPRLVGAGDRLFHIESQTEDLPSPRPKRGDELVQGSRHVRIARVDHVAVTGRSTFFVSEA